MPSFDKHTRIFTSKENTCLSKICEITKTCKASNMMVTIYLTKKDFFLYCSDAFKKSVGKNYIRLFDEGWNFWFSLIDKKEIARVRHKLIPFFSKPNLQESCVIKYHIINFYGERIFLKHEVLLHKLKKQIFAVNYFVDITVKEKIEHYFRIVEDSNDTLIKKEPITIISPREREVLALVADGFSSKQIAQKLFISNHTAITHRKNLIEKFRVKNTAQLIKKASRTAELW
ncbi:MAG: LuxR C-terminal-related transcriptional regulator [Flavobacteriaceae bacterium]|nr:LuxR C-terminal-related transcriptional regulator [Flavobacteriaceae bacterium]